MDLFDSIDESVDRPREVRSKRSMIVKCPLCLDDFASTEIEQHASLCLELNELITNPRNLTKGSTSRAQRAHRAVNKNREVSTKNFNKIKHLVEHDKRDA